jgi:hypothetical protein
MEIQTDNPDEGYPFPCYSYDKNNCITLNTAYIMSSDTIDVRYILGVLNSKLGKFLVKLYVTQLQARQFRMLAQYVQKFPIVFASNTETQTMIELVQKAIDSNCSKTANLIDELAYNLYGLSKDEIAFIENR